MPEDHVYFHAPELSQAIGRLASALLGVRPDALKSLEDRMAQIDDDLAAQAAAMKDLGDAVSAAETAITTEVAALQAALAAVPAGAALTPEQHQAFTDSITNMQSMASGLRAAVAAIPPPPAPPPAPAA